MHFSCKAKPISCTQHLLKYRSRQAPFNKCLGIFDRQQSRSPRFSIRSRVDAVRFLLQVGIGSVSSLCSHFLEPFGVISRQDSPRGRLWTESAGIWAIVDLWPPSPACSPLRRPQVLSVVVGPAAVAVGPKEKLFRSRHTGNFGLVDDMSLAAAPCASAGSDLEIQQ